MHCHLPAFRQNASEEKVDFIPNCTVFQLPQRPRGLYSHGKKKKIKKIRSQGFTYVFIPLRCPFCEEAERIWKVKDPDTPRGWPWLGSRASGGRLGVPRAPSRPTEEGTWARLRVTNNLGGQSEVTEVLGGVDFCYWERLKPLCV